MDKRMRSRMVREGSVGLLILAGIGLFGGLILWLRGFNPSNRSFSVTVEFATTGGVQLGSPVRYRGVTVGRISRISPNSNGVAIQIDIAPADLIIPRDSEVTVNQSGLLGETVLDIVPRKPLPDGVVAAKPLDRDCNKEIILCEDSRVNGTLGISTDELVRASIRFANVYSDPQFTGNINSLTKNSSDAAAQIVVLSKEVTSLVKSARQEVGTFSGTAKSISNAANQFGLTIGQVNSLVTANRATLVSTLDNLNQTSGQLRLTVARLSPTLDRIQQGQLIQNLETLSANAAQASTNLRDVSVRLNNPSNLTVLQQTLDSARATFQNAQKITADLDELTGDPQLRNDLRNLIKGLSGLTSSTQQLQQQAQVAQVLEPLATTAPQPTVTPEVTEPLFGITRSPSSLAPSATSP
ncbi:MAG: MlaD family protein [Phormidesmis sp. CAN_BIN44]|nr:MlaD family protein [Phormidesmis sp. CAN_BIN44]